MLGYGNSDDGGGDANARTYDVMFTWYRTEIFCITVMQHEQYVSDEELLHNSESSGCYENVRGSSKSRVRTCMIYIRPDAC